LTARPPIPAHPRLGTRLAYRLQRALRPRPGLRWLSARIEASGLVRPLFTTTERLTKDTLFGCRMCGQCALPVTGCAAIARLFNDRCVTCGTSPRGRVADLTLASFVALGGELERGCFNATIRMGR